MLSWTEKSYYEKKQNKIKQKTTQTIKKKKNP